VVGFWANQMLDRAFGVLPSKRAALHIYGPPLPEGERTTCRARIALVGNRQVRSNLDVVRADGRLWARFEGWEDHRFDVPPAVFGALLEPASSALARPWAVGSDAAANGLHAFRIGFDAFPPGWLHAHGGMWSRVLASLVLGRRERAIWHALTVSQQRRLEWLLGRVAAKDAVRHYLRRRFDVAAHPADVEIVPDRTGRPVVSLPWQTPDGRVPHVSISHVEGVAVAVLAEGDGITGLGIDIERCGRIKPGMEEMMFGACEREFLSGLEDEDRETWALRLWCAKEAAAKATGCATGPVSSALTVEHVHQERGSVVMRYTALDIGSVTLAASTARDGDWVVATCVDTSGKPMTEARTV
jgi:phosphopantetheinyl transferase